MGNDHDKLIQIATDVRNICNKQDDLKERIQAMDSKVEGQRTFCMDRINSVDKTYVRSKVWMWITAGLFLLVAGAYGFTHDVSNDVHEHHENTEIHNPIKGDK